MTTLELYFCATVLRGAFAVLFLLAVEAVLRHRLGAGFRRVLWLVCLVLMLVPQMNFSASPFRLDLSPSSAVRKAADAGKSGNGKEKRDIAPRAEDRGIAIRALWQNIQLHRKPIELGAIALLPLPALLLLLARYLRCRRTIRPLPPVSDRRVLEAWNRVLAECGPLPRPVILLDSSQPDLGPTLFGCFTRKLLLPINALRNLSDGELRLLLEHEYHHSRAGDPFINIVALVLWALAWYNPFMLIARRKLRASCEMACDHKILARHPHAVREYGNLLLRFVSPSAPSASPVAIGLAESPRELSSRIRSMTAAIRLPGSRGSGRAMAVLIALTLAAPVGLVAVNAKPISRPRPLPTAVPEKPVLPHLVLKPLPLPTGETELLQCWEVVYSEAFPYSRSELSLEIGGTRFEVGLEKKPGFLLLWQSNAPETVFRIEPATAPPTISLSEAEVAKLATTPRTIPAADRKAVYATLPHSGTTATVTLNVDGITPQELTNYRPIPLYR